MAIDNLSEQVQRAEVRRRHRYPLLDVVTDRKEIREISENTMEYLKVVYPDIIFTRWEIIPRVVIEFHKELISILDSLMKPGIGEVSIKLGDFMTFAVEQFHMEGADMEGSINPKIIMGPEMYYDNENPENNKMRFDIPETPITSTIQDICVNVTTTMERKFAVIFNGQWSAVYKTVFCFYRVVKEYLINHEKDRGDLGLTITLASLIEFTIQAIDVEAPDEIIGAEHDTSPENTRYEIYFNPDVDFKLTVKSNGKTERY